MDSGFSQKDAWQSHPPYAVCAAVPYPCQYTVSLTRLCRGLFYICPFHLSFDLIVSVGIRERYENTSVLIHMLGSFRDRGYGSDRYRKWTFLVAEEASSQISYNLLRLAEDSADKLCSVDVLALVGRDFQRTFASTN